jgi:hypothetical protein
MWSLTSAGMPASMVVKMHSTAKNFQSASNDVMVANSEATPEENPRRALGRQGLFGNLLRSSCRPRSTDSCSLIRHVVLDLFSENGVTPFLPKLNPKRVSLLRGRTALHISCESSLDIVDKLGQGAERAGTSLCRFSPNLSS